AGPDRAPTPHARRSLLIIRCALVGAFVYDCRITKSSYRIAVSTLSVPEKDLMAVNFTTRVSSSSQTVEICRGRPTVLIGERINPVVRSRMRQALEAADFATLQQAAVRQVEAGAAILDVNAEAPGIDEQALLKEVVASVASAVDVPLCIDTADPDALVGALEVYEGRALINSVT